MLRFFERFSAFSAILNGYAPFSKPFFKPFFKPFSGSKVGGLDRSEWVDMLRFRHIKQCVTVKCYSTIFPHDKYQRNAVKFAFEKVVDEIQM